jgi:hypothetical protein
MRRTSFPPSTNGFYGPGDVLCRGEASEMLKIPLGTLDYLVSTSEYPGNPWDLPFSRLGRRIIRFSRKRLQMWLDRSEGRPYVPPAERV